MPKVIKQKWEEEFDLDLSSIQSEYDQVADEIEITPIPESVMNRHVKKNLKKVLMDITQHAMMLINYRR